MHRSREKQVVIEHAEFQSANERRCSIPFASDRHSKTASPLHLKPGGCINKEKTHEH